jgi:hypothetical protein
MDSALIKNRKGSNSKPRVMLYQLPLLLIYGVIHAFLLIWPYRALGMSSLSVQVMTVTKAAKLSRNWMATAIWAYDMLIGVLC